MKYTIVYYNKTKHIEPVNEEIADYDELCKRVRQLIYYSYPDYRYQWGRNIVSATSPDGASLCVKVREDIIQPYKIIFMLSVYSSRNKPLNIEMLRKRGDTLFTLDCYRKDKHLWHEYRHGPVAGIHKSHGYNWFRKVKTTQEKRNQVAVFKDEGEPDFRRKRKNIPSAWDDVFKDRPKCWKNQSKARKSWAAKI